MSFPRSLLLFRLFASGRHHVAYHHAHVRKHTHTCPFRLSDEDMVDPALQARHDMLADLYLSAVEVSRVHNCLKSCALCFFAGIAASMVQSPVHACLCSHLLLFAAGMW